MCKKRGEYAVIWEGAWEWIWIIQKQDYCVRKKYLKCETESLQTFKY